MDCVLGIRSTFESQQKYASAVVLVHGSPAMTFFLFLSQMSDDSVIVFFWFVVTQYAGTF